MHMFKLTPGVPQMFTKHTWVWNVSKSLNCILLFIIVISGTYKISYCILLFITVISGTYKNERNGKRAPVDSI